MPLSEITRLGPSLRLNHTCSLLWRQVYSVKTPSKGVFIYMLNKRQLFLLSGSMIKLISSGWHVPSPSDKDISHVLIRGDEG